jgi:hypothetical protein
MSNRNPAEAPAVAIYTTRPTFLVAVAQTTGCCRMFPPITSWFSATSCGVCCFSYSSSSSMRAATTVRRRRRPLLGSCGLLLVVVVLVGNKNNSASAWTTTSTKGSTSASSSSSSASPPANSHHTGGAGGLLTATTTTTTTTTTKKSDRQLHDAASATQYSLEGEPILVKPPKGTGGVTRAYNQVVRGLIDRRALLFLWMSLPFPVRGHS